MKIKAADNDDLYDIFLWRNDPVSCKMFINNKVTFEEHKKWFANNFKNPLRKIYIGILKDEKVGVCHFEIDSTKTIAEVSINLNPIMRGKKLSYQLLSGSIETYKLTNEKKLRATIKKVNKASLGLFQRCNFFIIDEDVNYYYLTKN